MAGAVLVIVNNSPIVLRLLSATFGRSLALAPIATSAAAYPLRFGFRTGLSVAMFAVVIFSVVVMSVLLEGFESCLTTKSGSQGNYNVLALAGNDLNPLTDLSPPRGGQPQPVHRRAREWPTPSGHLPHRLSSLCTLVHHA